jgi:hypothetical protein
MSSTPKKNTNDTIVSSPTKINTNSILKSSTTPKKNTNNSKSPLQRSSRNTPVENIIINRVTVATDQDNLRLGRRLNRDVINNISSSMPSKKNKQTHSPDNNNAPASNLFPVRNPDNIDLLIAQKIMSSEFFVTENIDNLLKVRPRRGAVPEDVYISEKWVNYEIIDMFFLDGKEDELGFSQEQAHIFVYFLLNDAADEIEKLTMGESLFNNKNKPDINSKYNGFATLHNNVGSPDRNDNLRRYANGIIKTNMPLKCFINNFRCLLDRDRVIIKEAFGCGGSGEEDSITLLLALLGCTRQEDHYDYDFNLFKAHRNYDWMTPELIALYEDSYKRFNGASMFINMSWLETQYLDLDTYTESGNHNRISMGKMSITIMSGDLKHAGSANGLSRVVRKFFMYLDPCKGCRLKWVTKEIVSGENVSGTDNTIFFDSFSYLPKYAHLTRSK